MNKVSFLIFFVAAISGCSIAPKSPVDFQVAEGQRSTDLKVINEVLPCQSEAIRRGEELREIMLHGSGDPEASESRFVGKNVLLVGGTVAGAGRPGGKADLDIDGDFTLEVAVQPPGGVHPEGAAWRACVLGSVRHIDFKRKTVSVDAYACHWFEIMAL